MLSKKFFDRIRKEPCGKIESGLTLIAISLVLTLILGVVGCSGSHKLNPTDPTSSKQKNKAPTGETGTTGTLTQPGSDDGRGSGLSDSGGTGGTKDPILVLMEPLASRGGGQTGQFIKERLIVGVFDAVTHLPILEAVVCVEGDPLGGQHVNNMGYAFLPSDRFNPISNPSNIVGAPADIPSWCVTAGADGYEMVSNNFVTHEILVIMLHPPSSPIDTATIEGTFTFPTDNFYATAAATNVVDYVDSEFKPSGAGDFDDTFSLTVEANKQAMFTCVKRQPMDEKILRVYYETIPALTPGQVFQIEVNERGQNPVSNPNAPGGSGKWHDYMNLNQCRGDIILLPHLEDSLESLNINMMLYSPTLGALPMMDRVRWQETNNIHSFETFYNPVVVKELQTFNGWMLWADIRYDDGSGTYELMDYGKGLKSNNVLNVGIPPIIQIPENGSLGVGLTPEITWLCNDKYIAYTQIQLTDNVNGNRWTIFTKPGRTLTLPALCESMQSWGLTVGNEVSMVVEQNLSNTTWVSQGNGEMVELPDTVGLYPRNYSVTNTFTP